MTVNEYMTFGSVVLAGICLFALFRSLGRRKPVGTDEQPPHNAAIIDGSNVMYWKDGTPDLNTVRNVVDRLRQTGFSPGVVFDANAGYLLTGKYQHDKALARALDLPENRVMVVPKGTPADPMILKAARDMKARVITNDRFRDWAGDFPEIRQPGHLIRGGFRSGELSLHLDHAARRRQPRKKRTV